MKSAFGGKIDKNYCESLKGVWVDEYMKEDGTKVDGYCRRPSSHSRHGSRKERRS